MSTVLFPLRTSVELFEDRGSPEAITRAKQAAVLYDEVIFESGVYDMTTTEGQGSMDMWLPFDRMSPDLLKRKRQPIPVGGGMQVTIQLQDGENGPPVGEPFAFLDGKVGVQYVSEFWTDIMEPLAAFRPDWVRSVTTGGTQLEGALGEAQAQLIRSDAADKALMADLDRFHREFVLKAFNRDALVAANLGAAFNVTRTFLPMVERRQAARDHSGSEALDIIVPNVGVLPWEAVIEWREHPGSAEARAVLRGFEERAAEAEPEDANAFLKQIARQVMAGYAAAAQELAPNLPAQLQDELQKTVISFVPVVGPLLEKGVTIADLLVTNYQYRRSWIAALWELRAKV